MFMLCVVCASHSFPYTRDMYGKYFGENSLHIESLSFWYCCCYCCCLSTNRTNNREEKKKYDPTQTKIKAKQPNRSNRYVQMFMCVYYICICIYIYIYIYIDTCIDLYREKQDMWCLQLGARAQLHIVHVNGGWMCAHKHDIVYTHSYVPTLGWSDELYSLTTHTQYTRFIEMHHICSHISI